MGLGSNKQNAAKVVISVVIRDCDDLAGMLSLFAFSACMFHVAKAHMASSYTWPSS